MADEAATPPAQTPAEPVTADPGDPAALAAFQAEVDAQTAAAAANEGPLVPEPSVPGEEKPAETAAEPSKTEDKPAEPTPDAEARKARAILAAAKKAQAEADAKAKTEANALLELARKSPGKFLAKTGLTVDEFLAAVAEEREAKPTEAPKPDADARIAALEKELADQKAANEKAAADRQKVEQDAFVAKRTAEIAAAIKADAKTFPHINRGNAHQLVVDVIVERFEKDGVRLGDLEAAAAVEKYLAELAGDAAEPPKTGPAAALAAPPRVPSPTLTNDAVRGAAPAEDGLSPDPDVRLKQVMRELERANN